MAQPPTDQNYYHHHHHPSHAQGHPHSHPQPHPHTHHHQHSHSHSHTHTQLQLPPQFRNPFNLLFDNRTGAINYNYIRPYLPNQMAKPPDELPDSLVMRRPRRTRTTFTSSQVAELEQHFLQGRYLTAPRLAELSEKLALGTAQVKIWFKNRRRRHKIQLDKDQSYDAMPALSPALKTDIDPPNLQTLNINGDATTNHSVLTPSPTPNTPTVNIIEPYANESYNSYYYNGRQSDGARAPACIPIHSHAVTVPQYTPSLPKTSAATAPPLSSAASTTQFFGTSGMQPQHIQQSHHNPVQLTPQQQQQPQQQTYQQFDCRALMIKDDPDANYNYNNSNYYMRSSNTTTTALEASTTTSALSPSSDVYEPLTPKNDENSSICNGNSNGNGSGRSGNSVSAFEHINESSKKSLQNLVPRKIIGLDKVSDNINHTTTTTLPLRSATPLATVATTLGRLTDAEICESVYSKYSKMSHDANMVQHHETSYQCTMDTLMQAYNPHRNATGNAQFAYCFN